LFRDKIAAFLGIDSIKVVGHSRDKIEITIDSNSAIGECNTADCTSSDAGYDPRVDTNKQGK